MNSTPQAKNYEVVIIGGGPAGLGAAMALGRMSRHVLLCDDGRPRNAAAEHMNNFTSHDGLAPALWRERAKQDLVKYESVELHRGHVQQLEKTPDGFRVSFSNEMLVDAKKVILACGVLDELPDVPGFKELWGKSIYHCPFCHGFEVRDQKLGLVANGPMLEHILPMIYGLSKDVVVFTNGTSNLKPLTQEGVRVIETSIARLHHAGVRLTSVELETGEQITRDGLFVAPRLPFRAKFSGLTEITPETNEMGFIKVDALGQTSVEGLFAAGDIMSGLHSVVGALASGQLAGGAVASHLLSEKFRATS